MWFSHTISEAFLRVFSADLIIERCSLMRYLCQRAAKTVYLSHFERLSVRYVFAHLGEKGKEFVHQVMSFTLNYQYNITEKFIRKCPEKPISCLKLRDQYFVKLLSFGYKKVVTVSVKNPCHLSCTIYEILHTMPF